MEIQSTFIEGCFIIKPKVFKDERGLFLETFNKKIFEEISGVKVDFVQDNQSISKRGVLRGLHFQTGEYTQAKLVHVIQGEVLDVAVDLRPGSKTYKKYFSIILNDQNNLQLFIPKGFAHGFLTLSESAVFAYKCDNYYCQSAESGIIYNDPDIAIDWKLGSYNIVLSQKDRELLFLKDIENV